MPIFIKINQVFLEKTMKMFKGKNDNDDDENTKWTSIDQISLLEPLALTKTR